MTQKLICSTCGHVGSPRTAVKGNGLIELILWLCLLVPGVIYSIWRSTSRYKTCTKCGASNLIPLDSPTGQKLLADQGKTMEQVLTEKEPPRTYSRAEKLKIGVVVVVAMAVVTLMANAV